MLSFVASFLVPSTYESTPSGSCSIAACDGRFYFNGVFDELGVLELGPAPAFSSVAIRDAIEQPFGCRKEFLVESRGELFMVSLLSPSDPSVVRRSSSGGHRRQGVPGVAVVLRRLAPGGGVRAGAGLRLRGVRGDEVPAGVQREGPDNEDAGPR